MVFSDRFTRIAFLITALLGLPLTAWAQQHFTNCLSNTANDATVILPDDATVSVGGSDSLSTGDEIALYSNDGRCAGAAVWDSSKTAVSIAVADRDSTAGIIEGYEAGEQLKFRIWRASDGQEIRVSSASYTCSLAGCRIDGVYKRNAVYELTELDASSTLPVELATFEAKQQEQSVVLQWRTAGESNNSGFKVQHKTESRSSWSTLSFVEGAGTSSKPQDYRYETTNLEYGTHQFRLAQIDHDGSRNTTQTVEVAFSLDSAHDISKVYPNPIRGSGTLELAVKKAQTVVVRLYDILGREQGVLFKSPLPANQTETVQLDTDRLPSGQYFLQIEGESFRVTRRVTVVK